MRSLKQYWQYLSASIKKSFKTHVHRSPSQEELKREISAVSSANQALSESQEELCREIAAARSKDKNKLAELERIINTLETIRQEGAGKFDELENRLNEIESERNKARDQVKVLKTSLVETSTQLRKTDNQLKALQDGFMEQAKEFKTALSRATTRLETTDHQVRKLEVEQRQHEKTFQETQAQLRTQARRLIWSMMVAGIAVMLAAMSGAIYIRDVNKNTTLLASMNDGIKHLLTSMDQHLNTTHHAVADRPTATALGTPDTTAADKTLAMDSSAVMTPPGVLLGDEDEISGNSATQGYLLDGSPDAIDTRRKNSRILSSIQKKTFFKEDTVDWKMTSLPGGLHYRVVTPGRGRSPDITDRVVVNYLTVSPDGKVTDDTYSSGQPAMLHMSEVTPALQEALLTMGEGAEWEVHVPEQQPYKGAVPQRGMQGFEPGVYLIELVEVLEDYTPDQPMQPE